MSATGKNADKRTPAQRKDDAVNSKIRNKNHQTPTANNTEANFVSTGPGTGKTDERNK